MPFTLIKGLFQPSSGQPDGDSLRFVPDNPGLILDLRRRGQRPKINPDNDSIQLRYEAIDTMEKRALEPFSSDATKSNLDLAGTDGGSRNARGHVYANQLDPNGRLIAFVFSGESEGVDGGSVFLGPNDITGSINLRQLELGHAYPLYYDTLFDDLRRRCTEASEAARAKRLRIWGADASLSGARWTGNVETLPPLFPKLWRRIDTFTRDDTLFDPTRPFANLKRWIAQVSPERVIISETDTVTGFDNVIETTDDTVRMTVDPHKIVVVSAPQTS